MKIEYLMGNNVENTLWNDYMNIMMQEEKELENLKNTWRNKLKDLINCSGLWRNLDEDLDYWKPIGLVQVRLTDEKFPSYSAYQYGREVDSDLLYLKQNCDVRGIAHQYVYQVTGHMGDDFSGFLLFPLKDGRYFKIGYSC